MNHNYGIRNILCLLCLAKICLFNRIVIQKVIGIAFQHYPPCLEDVGPISDGKGFFGILLYKKHCCAAGADFFDNIEYFVYKDRG